MELTLRWAERSKKYFEEHKHEVPWGRGHVGTAAPSCPGAHRRRDASTTETELRSTGRARSRAPTWDGMTQSVGKAPACSAVQPRAAASTDSDHTQPLVGIV